LFRLLDVIREEAQALRDNKLPEVIDIGIRKGPRLPAIGSCRAGGGWTRSPQNQRLSVPSRFSPFVELASYTTLQPGKF